MGTCFSSNRYFYRVCPNSNYMKSNSKENYINTEERKEQCICKTWTKCCHLMRLIQWLCCEYCHRKKPKMIWKSICTVLNQHHRKIFRREGLITSVKSKDFIVKEMYTIETFKDMVKNKLRTSSLLLGYRQMTETLAVRYSISLS